MSHRTLLHAIAKWASDKIVVLDDWIFAADDRNAAAHGWQIDRGRRLSRTYRDPRWDQIEEYRAVRPHPVELTPLPAGAPEASPPSFNGRWPA